MDHFCETIHESNGVVKTMKNIIRKDIFDGLINLELYALYINKYINIREIEDFKKLVKENMDEEDKEYEMMLSNLKYHRITGYVSCNNKSSDKDDKEQVKDNESSRKEK